MQEKILIVTAGNTEEWRPIDLTTASGKIINYFVNKKDYDKGLICQLYTADELKNSDGKINICKWEEK
jgi:hypothetical protein